MSEQNIVEVIVVPEVPKVVSDEEIYVYVPVATASTKGIASFDVNSMKVVAGVVYVNDRYVNDLIDVEVQPLQVNKLDKLTTAGEHVYSHSGNVQEEISVSADVHPDSLVKRLGDGGILVPDDGGNEHSAVNLSKVNKIVAPLSEGIANEAQIRQAKDEEIQQNVDNKFGNIDSALDNVIEIQNALIEAGNLKEAEITEF